MADKKNGVGVLGTATPVVKVESHKDNLKTIEGKGSAVQNGIKKPVPQFNIQHFTGEQLLNSLEVPQRVLADYDEFRITAEKEVPATPPLALIGTSPVLAPGNITPITAEGKAGKTAATSVFIAGGISQNGEIDGFTGLEIMPNLEGKALMHFDTEQSEADQQYNLKNNLKRAGFSQTPDFYRSYNIRNLPLSEYQNFTNSVCELSAKEFGGIYLIVVDGGADYITSVNNEEEANAIVAFFINLAVTYNCPVLLVIHLNENAGKNGDTIPRGHVGRQAIRKGYCQLNITKEGDISTMQALRARKASSVDTPLICFKYDKERGYHTTVDAEEIANQKQSEKELANRARAEKLAQKILPPPAALRYTDLITRLMNETSKSKPTAKRTLENIEGWGIVVKGEDGNYRLKI